MASLRSIFAFAIVVGFLLLGGGCAFVDNEVQLEYQDVPNLKPVTSGQRTIFMSLFNDNRNDKAKVGVIRNAYGMETAAVLTKDNPVIWISNALKGNLEKVGYKVETVHNNFAPSDGQFYLSGRLVRIFSDPRMGFFTVTFLGDVQALVQAQYNGKKTEKMIMGHYEEDNIVSSGGDLHKNVLNMALQDFVKKFLIWLESLKS